MKHRNKQNNKGFTLVELIVCMVVFAIVLAAVFGFMLASADSYSNVSNRISIELQGQVAASQITEYITDCSYGICVEEGATEGESTLYIVDRDGDSDTTCVVHAYQYLTTTGVIKYGKTGGTINADTGVVTPTNLEINVPLTKYTEGFLVDLADDDTENPRVRLAEVSVLVKVHEDTGTTVKSVALRNRPILMEATGSGANVILTPKKNPVD